MSTATADLSDEYGEKLGYCDTVFQQYGRRHRFNGAITTVRCFEDIALLKSILNQGGAQGVLVVDGGGSLHAALLGDTMARLAIDNDWAGVVIYGAVRDVGALAGMDLGIKARGSHPRRSSSSGEGEKNVPVAFGGCTFRPGEQLFSDADGIVVLSKGAT